MPAMLRMENTVKLWIANVGRGANKAKFRRSIAKIKRAAGPRAVIGLQEIDEADVPNEMDDILWMFRWTHKVVGEKLAVPILVPKRFDTFGHQVRLGSPGLAKFTPYRPINRVGVELPLSRAERTKLGADELAAYFYNFHIPISRPETQDRRAEMIEKVQEWTREDKRDGHNGAWLADTNWRRARDGALPRIVPGEKQVLGGAVGTHAEIDVAKAWAGADTGLRVVVRNRRHVDLTIDGHNGHGADLLWVPRSARKAA